MVGQNGFTLTWTAVSGATSYDVTVGSNTYNTTTNSYTATGLTASTTYSSSVRSNCASGSSAYSASINTTTADAPAVCNVPTGLASSAVSQTGFTLTWDAVSGATSYDVRVGSNTYNTTNNSYTATGLTASTTYSF